jgi:hypothetical protein
LNFPPKAEGVLAFSKAEMGISLWLYYANGFNQARPEFGDEVREPKDWFRPFAVSAMISAEGHRHIPKRGAQARMWRYSSPDMYRAPG